MTENNRAVQQDDNQKHVELLRKLQKAAELQNKSEVSEALTAAIEALEAQQEDDPKKDSELPLSVSLRQSNELVKMARDVRLSTPASADRLKAVAHLTRLAKK